MNNIFTTENLSRWGAITGTVGAITGILGLIFQFVKFRQERQHVKIVTDIHWNEDDNLESAITVYSLGNDPVHLEKVRFYLRQPGWRRLFSWYFHRQSNRYIDEIFQPPPSLTKNQNYRWLIDPPQGFRLSQFSRLDIIDQSGRKRGVPWYGQKRLEILTRKEKINSHSEAMGDRTIDLTIYLIGNEYVLKSFFHEQVHNVSTGISFRTIGKNLQACENALNMIRKNQGEQFLQGHVSIDELRM